MPTLLHIDSSPLRALVSRELTREFVRTWKTTHPQGDIIYRDLSADPPPPIEARWIAAACTPADALSRDESTALVRSDTFISELECADEYVIGVATYNFNIPGVLKLWIDQVVRVGRTFGYTEEGYEGLLQGKKATIVVTSGGVYAAGTPEAARNHIQPYLQTIFAIIGVTGLNFIAVDGSARIMSGTEHRHAILKAALEQVRAAAA